MSEGDAPAISVVVLTHNRCHLLRRCVENVLLKTSSNTVEIVIWNNASGDDTREYLDSIEDPRFEIVHHPVNIGVNAYARVFPRTIGTHLVEVDDDVIAAPADWDATLLDAFERVPRIGYLAANLELNPEDITSSVMYGPNAQLYRVEEVNGVRLKLGGPVGGWCSMTSRELHDRIGGWSERRQAFWQEEGVYLEGLGRLGYAPACLEDLRVLHAAGPRYSSAPKEKLDYWRAYNRRVMLKNRVKRALLAVTPVRRLNERYGWFEPPRERPDYVQLYGGA